MAGVSAPEHSVVAERAGYLPKYPLDFEATMSALLARAARRYGPEAFLISASTTLSFQDLEARSQMVALALLQQGMCKGSRVGLYVHNGIEWAIGFTAITRIGAIAMPISTFYKPKELYAVIKTACMQFLLAGPVLDLDLTATLLATLPDLHQVATEDDLFLRSAPFLRRILSIGIEGADPSPWLARIEDVVLTAPLRGLAGEEFLAEVERGVEPSDWMVVIHTSGTTARAKGVIHTHGAQVRHAANLAEFEGWREGEASLAAMPFFWVGGLTYTFMRALYAGVSLLIQPKFEPAEALQLCARAQPTSIMGTPTGLKRLNAHPLRAELDLGKVPFLDPIGASVKSARSRHNALGMTETCGPHSTGPANERNSDLSHELEGSYGRPLPCVQHRIATFEDNQTLPEGDVGEICVRGYSVAVGQLGVEREDLFDADGWFHTGDFGYLKDGCLFYLGRATSMIKTAGSNVAPPEVEAALLSFPGISEAIVFDVPDDERGDAVGAVVVPDTTADVSAAELVEAMRAVLSSYKVPRLVQVWRAEEVPLLPSGKVDRRATRDAAIGLAARSATLSDNAQQPT
jgi:acyl-CoA synthetase (AMP-forming)/AMP-acid ligase II